VKSNLYRTIDANLNRFKEGIRVVEDILRYEFNSPLAKKLKEIRHIKVPEYDKIISFRDSNNDILKPSTKSEQKRVSLEDIIIANLKRAQESARVLEEVYKIYNINLSEEFKNKRYQLYSLEKEIFEILRN
jgi:thiamine-phosphate pyrophosphorylase